MIETEEQQNYMSGRLPISESRQQSRVDYLIRIGLGDSSKLPYYRRIVNDPVEGTRQQYLRQYTASLLDNLLEMVFTDSLIYNRVKTLLLRKHHSQASGKLTEEVSEDGLKSLIKKSVENETPLEILFQVYSRGASLHEHYKNKTPEQLGFARVNSFLAGGRARQDDADLLEDKKSVSLREHRGTLGIIKRILKEGRD